MFDILSHVFDDVRIGYSAGLPVSSCTSTTYILFNSSVLDTFSLAQTEQGCESYKMEALFDVAWNHLLRQSWPDAKIRAFTLGKVHDG